MIYLHYTLWALPAAVAFCLWWLEVTHFYRHLKLTRRKPFNCEACLPAYVAAILFCLPATVSIFIFVIFAAPVITTYLIKIITKWLS